VNLLVDFNPAIHFLDGSFAGEGAGHSYGLTVQNLDIIFVFALKIHRASYNA
jgi:hypothetical protein